MKKYRIVLFFLAALLLFSSCTILPSLKKTEAGYVHSKTEVVYTEAPIDILAARRTTKAVARLKDATGKHPLYSAGEDLLCYEDGALFVPVGTTFPTLIEFSANRVNLCKEESVRVELATSTNEDLIRDISMAFFNMDIFLTKDHLPQGFTTSRYPLLLLSKVYPNYCFQLEYYVFEKGDDPYSEWPYETDAIGYLYDRENDCYAFAPTSLYDLLTGALS